jgi:hypothetical protein
LGELIILNYDGAKTILWDPDENRQVQVAEKEFNALIKKGFSALTIHPGKEEGKSIDCFDSRAAKILMFPILTGG